MKMIIRTHMKQEFCRELLHIFYKTIAFNCLRERSQCSYFIGEWSLSWTRGHWHNSRVSSW